MPVSARGAWNTLIYVFGAVTGLIAYAPGYLTRPATRVLVAGHDGDPVQMDGDCHSSLSIEVSLCERALRVVAPYAGAIIS